MYEVININDLELTECLTKGILDKSMLLHSALTPGLFFFLRL